MDDYNPKAESLKQAERHRTAAKRHDEAAALWESGGEGATRASILAQRVTESVVRDTDDDGLERSAAQRAVNAARRDQRGRAIAGHSTAAALHTRMAESLERDAAAMA